MYIFIYIYIYIIVLMIIIIMTTTIIIIIKIIILFFCFFIFNFSFFVGGFLYLFQRRMPTSACMIFFSIKRQKVKFETVKFERFNLAF